MIMKTYRASECGAKLDSNVLTGGGTDDTAAIQAVLDKAANGDGVHLIMDGAALITGIRLYSNTTVECLNPACGFYLKDGSDYSIVTNAHMTKSKNPCENPVTLDMIEDENIALIGGTYNHNCAHQCHDTPRKDCDGTDFTVTFWFEGVRRLTLKDLTIRDQRTFSALITNWEFVNVENVHIDLPGKVHAQNQDGLHFFGPGRFLNIKNLSGNAGDDFLALAPDENDKCSCISDVNIDGVRLEDADQGIRMLVRNKGRLDRVSIRNVTGTYRSFGFFINPFFDDGVDKKGGYGDIIIDTVDLHQNGVDYDYTPPMLFALGGRFDHITLRNIYSVKPNDNRALVKLGWQAGDDSHVTDDILTDVGCLIIDGLHVLQDDKICNGMDFIQVKDCRVKNFTLRNAEIVRDGVSGGNLINLMDRVHIDTLSLTDVTADGLDNLVTDTEGKVKRFNKHDINF